MATGPESVSETIERLIRVAHERTDTEPLVGFDAAGAFPDPIGFTAWNRRDTPPVVLDTNLLCRDVGRVARTQKRTVLVNAANSGALRVLCPGHVAAEVVEHTDKFAGIARVRPDQFAATWRQTYLPLLRFVPDLEQELLTASESYRIEVNLRLKDPTDIPAAVLAIAAGAFFLSEDQNALKAVFGSLPSYDLHDEVGFRPWVDQLKGFGDSSELDSMLGIGAVLVRLLRLGATSVGRAAAKHPEIAAATALVAAVTALRSQRSAADAAARVRQALGATAEHAFALIERAEAVADRLEALAAPMPDDLPLLDSQRRAERHVLRHVARIPQSLVTASLVSATLPPHCSPRGEAAVRRALRTSPAFTQPYRGKFQLGHAAPVG